MDRIQAIQSDYFTSRPQSDGDSTPPFRTPESVDLGIEGASIRTAPFVEPPRASQGRGVSNNVENGSVQGPPSRLSKRASKSSRYGSRLLCPESVGPPQRSIRAEGAPSRMEHPPRGWTDAHYFDENPWYGQPKNRPIFSLGRPLPHVVRRRVKKPRRVYQARDEEQGQLGHQDIWADEIFYDHQPRYTASDAQLPRRLPVTPSRGYLEADCSFRDIQNLQSVATVSGVAHGPKRNEAGQPVFEYNPGEAERQEPGVDDALSRSSTIREEESTEDMHNPQFKINDEPLGRQEKPEVEEGERDPDELRNWWARVRARHPEPLAEFLATGVATFMGLAGTLAVNLSTKEGTAYGDYETSCLAWGYAWMFGIYVGGGVSGAHMNPAISISLSLFRGFPWRQCIVYICAQTIGGFVAAWLAYACYADSINHLDVKMTKLSETFFSTPQDWVSPGSAFFNQVVGGAIMTIAVFALGDDQNNPPGAGMHAFILGLLVTTLKFTLGFNIGSALNPASDFGPRIVAFAVGCRESKTFDTQWWLYGPWLATILGSVVGCIIYDGCIFVGTESPVNYRMSESIRDKIRSLYLPLIRVRKSSGKSSGEDKR